MEFRTYKPQTHSSHANLRLYIQREVAKLKRKAEILPPKYHMMAKMKFDPNKGLGIHSQGRTNPVKAIRVPYKVGLGFKHQFKKNKNKKAGRKTAQYFVSELSKTCTTLPNESQLK